MLNTESQREDWRALPELTCISFIAVASGSVLFHSSTTFYFEVLFHPSTNMYFEVNGVV